jgi:hypothetical protein
MLVVGGHMKKLCICDIENVCQIHLHTRCEQSTWIVQCTLLLCTDSQQYHVSLPILYINIYRKLGIMFNTRGCRQLFVSIWRGDDLDAFVFIQS